MNKTHQHKHYAPNPTQYSNKRTQSYLNEEEQKTIKYRFTEDKENLNHFNSILATEKCNSNTEYKIHRSDVANVEARCPTQYKLQYLHSKVIESNIDLSQELRKSMNSSMDRVEKDSIETEEKILGKCSFKPIVSSVKKSMSLSINPLEDIKEEEMPQKKPKQKIFINMEDTISLEAKLWDIIEALKCSQNIKDQCDSWWELNRICSLRIIEVHA